MEIKIICKKEKFEKESLYKNGRKKCLLYYKCKTLVICRDLIPKDSPVVSVYPSMRSLVDKFKKLKKKREPKFCKSFEFIKLQFKINLIKK